MKQIYKILAFFVCVACCVTATAQMRTVTFTGRDRSGHYRIPLSRVVVFNLDQLWEEILYYPDTILVLGSVGIDDYGEKQEIQLMQNVPNPFDGTTEFVLALPEKRDVLLEIYDVTGKLTVNQHFSALPAGTHLFQATLSSPQTYLLSARMDDGQMTIKMVNQGHGGENSIRYLGTTDKNGNFTVYLNNEKSYTKYPFHVGDEMRYVAYPQVSGVENRSVAVTKAQTDNETIVFNFDFIVPSVTTDEVYDITTTTATCSATVISDGNLPISKRGVCWSTSPDPTMHNDRCDNVGGVGSFTCDLSGLTEGASYYVRAYAINFLDTVYGPPKRFTTLVRPTVTTDMVSNITSTSATCGGNVTDDGGNPVTQRGVCWSVSPNPTYYNNFYTLAGSGTGSFTCNITGLAANTTYYVRAFARSSAGRAYGEERTFTTAATTPMVTTNAVSSITSTSATCGGQVTNNGGAPVTACGVCWNTSPNPSLNDNLGFTNDYSGTFSFMSSITGLAPGTTYYVKAYATNSAGTAYGVAKNFTTITPPIVTTNTITSFTATTATFGGNVTNNGGTTVTERGVCWSSTSANPTLGDTHKASGSGNGSFSVNVYGLEDNTTCYVRAYAIYVGTACGDTVYGDTKTFTTSSFTCGNSITDFEGYSYNTVLIGQQCWMAMNLKTTHLNNGVSIPLVQDSTSWGNTTSAACCYYNQGTYGCLYNFYAVEGGQLCPPGWHVPSYDEVHATLINALGGDGGGGMKTTGTTYWLSPNTGATNSSGFSARGGGYRQQGRSISLIKERAVFWISTIYNDSYAYDYSLFYSHAALDRYGFAICDYAMWKKNGLSVRCLRGDIPPVTIPTVSTRTVSHSSFDTATSGGYINAMGDAVITAKGVCWSTMPNPTISDSHTNEGGGVMNFTSSITGLSQGSTYYVRAYATNSAGTAYGEQVSFTTASPTDGHPCLNAPTVTDIDNNTYNTVQIGTQCWMAENLRTTKYADGTIIPLGNTTSTTTAYRYRPNNSSSNVSTYGYLYNWKAVMHNSSSSNNNPSGVQGICPTGWHVPSDAEWTQLTDYVGGISQYRCSVNSVFIAKALAYTSGWISSSVTCDVGNNPSSNNATGFSARPAGTYSGSNYTFGYEAAFWSATHSDGSNAYDLNLSYDFAYVFITSNPKIRGFSVRCLRDGGGGGANQHVIRVSLTTDTYGSDITWQVKDMARDTVLASGGPYSDLTDSDTAAQNIPDILVDGTGCYIFTINDSYGDGFCCPAGSYSVSYDGTIMGSGVGSDGSFCQESYFLNPTSSSCPSANGPSCPRAATVTDVDNNTYNTVQIGTQCWMAENLRTTRYANGTTIPLGTDTSTTTAYRYNPNNDASNVPTYGYLYNWKAVMRDASSSSANPSGVAGVCPWGWHVPSDAEWTQLTDHVRSQSQYVCGSDNTYIAKALASSTGWISSSSTCAVGNNQSANNTTGFNSLPAGYYYGYYNGLGYYAFFWSATQDYGDFAYFRGLFYSYAYVVWGNNNKNYGSSVRCVRDEGSSINTPVVTTNMVSNIATSTASCGGNVTSDGGATVTARGVCWGTSQNPTVNSSHTTDGGGTGSFTSNITGLTPGTTYYVRAYATNSAGTAYGEQQSFTTASDGQPCPATPTVTDYDGITYVTVQLGTQCWMAQNLRSTHYSDGTTIPLGTDTSTTTAYRYNPNNDASNVPTYGYLYNWKAVMRDASSSSANPSGVAGVCPWGWHVPSVAEWTQLTDYVSSQSQYVCGSNNVSIGKALASTTGWNNSTNNCAVGNNQSANNTTGFSALPAGLYTLHYFYPGYYAYFWSTTSNSSDGYANGRSMNYDSTSVNWPNFNTYYGYSVRCLRN